jgi:hypothetical protein
MSLMNGSKSFGHSSDWTVGSRGFHCPVEKW